MRARTHTHTHTHTHTQTCIHTDTIGGAYEKYADSCSAAAKLFRSCNIKQTIHRITFQALINCRLLFFFLLNGYSCFIDHQQESLVRHMNRFLRVVVAARFVMCVCVCVCVCDNTIFTLIHSLTPFCQYKQKLVLQIHTVYFIHIFILRFNTLIHICHRFL